MAKPIIVDTGNKYGNMNSAKKFYPEDWTPEQRAREFLKHRIAVGNDYGFDGHKMFMADQEHKTGTYFEITNDYVGANPNGWTDIPQDILIITEKTPGIVIGHPVADCPVVMMTDVKKGVTAIGHCSAELIDKKMPMMVADALLSAYHSRDEDIITYVSSCASDSWTYNNYPSWAKDARTWEGGIYTDDNNIFHIDLRKVIAKQLQERNISNVNFNMNDTITNENYFSNFAASPYGLNDPSKEGRNFDGIFYPEENRGKTR